MDNMKSHVLKVLKEYDSVNVGQLTVSGNQVRYIANDGSYFYIDFQRPISDILRGGSSSATVRTNTR